MVSTVVPSTKDCISYERLDPREVAKYAIEVSNGLTEGGVAPTAKHFPGHGDTHVDSHLALPVIKKTERELHETELVPFRALIEARVATIMTGHMALPLMVGEDDKETPCSCSRTVTRELLRHELGFEGVIVTDCLEMAAVAAKYTSQKGAVLSLQAGADVVMICHTMGLQTGAIAETYKAVEKGELSLAELRESGGRIDKLKARFSGTWKSALAELDEGGLAEIVEAHAKLSDRAYGASTAVIQGPLPDVGPGPVLVLTPEMESVNKAVDDAEEKNTLHRLCRKRAEASGRDTTRGVFPTAGPGRRRASRGGRRTASGGTPGACHFCDAECGSQCVAAGILAQAEEAHSGGDGRGGACELWSI